MNDIEASSLVYEALSEIRGIETALVSMWSLGNKYARIPFLRFRFKSTSKDDVIYTRLNNIIDSYSGRLKWRMLTRDNVLNYILIPEIFEKYFLEHKSVNSSVALVDFTEEEYKAIIDTVIIDVPDLAKYIRASFK